MCMLGVKQGESLSPFLFSMYINDIEEFFIRKGVEGTEMGMLKSFIYADDMALFSESKEGLQNGLCMLEEYCDTWNLQISIHKTKMMILKRVGK